jgi:hypothetical protein
VSAAVRRITPHPSAHGAPPPRGTAKQRYGSQDAGRASSAMPRYRTVRFAPEQIDGVERVEGQFAAHAARGYQDGQIWRTLSSGRALREG